MIKRLLPLVLTIVVLLTGIPICQAVTVEDNAVVEKKRCTATIEDEFEEDSVIVVLTEESSSFNQVLSLDYFDSNLFVSVEDLMCFEEEISDLHFLNKDSFNQVYLLKLKNPGKENVLKAIRQLEDKGFVQYACPNYIYSIDDIDIEEDDTNICEEIARYVVPNDASFSEQYGLRKINVSAAWEIATGSSNVTVGVLDTGIDCYHPDLVGQCNTALAKNFTGDGLGALVDPHGHGTHVAGIIGAKRNDIGVVGVCWNISLVPLRVLDCEGEGSVSWLTQAIAYAIANNIPILNCSLGGDGTDDDLMEMLDNYTGLMVCAAGNEGRNIDVNPYYPASYNFSNIISVAGTDENDTLYEYGTDESNYGATTVDLAAPGEGIKSTVPGNAYEEWTGTSMAAPFVTGVAALIKSVRPEMSAIEIKNCILQGATPIEALSGKCVTGGLLNAKGAFVKAGLIETPKIVSGDFNGDGKDDVAEVIRLGDHRTQFAVQLSNGSGFGDQTAWFDNASYAAAGIDQRAVAGDFNGDGKDDLAVLYNYGDGDLKFFTYLSTGSQFSTSQQWYDWYAGADYIDNRFVAGDFNGDGKDDVAVMFRYPSGTVNIFTFISNGSSFTRQTWNEWSADMSYVENRFVAGDFNGDGKDDTAVMFRYPSGTVNIFAFISNGSSFTRQTWNEWSADMSYVENRFVAGDFNGDGKDDTAVLFCYPNGTVNLFVFCSNGSSFTRVNWLNWSANVSYIENRFTVGDFDGNAKDDAVVLFQYPSGQSNLFTFMSNGGYFTRENWYQWDA